MTARLLLVPVAFAALLLAGCTSDFLVDGGGNAPVTAAPTPTASPTDASPTPTATPSPTAQGDCGSLLLTRPGTYVIGDCDTVTIEGANIDVSFGAIQTLIVRGDGAELDGHSLADVDLSGQGNSIEVVTLGQLHIRGDENRISVEQTLHSVIVDGNGNTLAAGDGIDQKADNGIGNTFE